MEKIPISIFLVIFMKVKLAFWYFYLIFSWRSCFLFNHLLEAKKFLGCSYQLVEEFFFKIQVKVLFIISRIKVKNSQDLEELIADSMTGLMIRAERLNEFDQLAISAEFREWLNEGVRVEDVLKLVTIKK